jgi:hypothetical protein
MKKLLFIVLLLLYVPNITFSQTGAKGLSKGEVQVLLFTKFHTDSILSGPGGVLVIGGEGDTVSYGGGVTFVSNGIVSFDSISNVIYLQFDSTLGTGAVDSADAQGRLYYDKDLQTLKFWNGEIWASIRTNAPGAAPSAGNPDSLGGYLATEYTRNAANETIAGVWSYTTNPNFNNLLDSTDMAPYSIDTININLDDLATFILNVASSDSMVADSALGALFATRADSADGAAWAAKADSATLWATFPTDSGVFRGEFLDSLAKISTDTTRAAFQADTLTKKNIDSVLIKFAGIHYDNVAGLRDTILSLLSGATGVTSVDSLNHIFFGLFARRDTISNYTAVQNFTKNVVVAETLRVTAAAGVVDFNNTFDSTSVAAGGINWLNIDCGDSVVQYWTNTIVDTSTFDSTNFNPATINVDDLDDIEGFVQSMLDTTVSDSSRVADSTRVTNLSDTTKNAGKLNNYTENQFVRKGTVNADSMNIFWHQFNGGTDTNYVATAEDTVVFDTYVDTDRKQKAYLYGNVNIGDAPVQDLSISARAQLFPFAGINLDSLQFRYQTTKSDSDSVRVRAYVYDNGGGNMTGADSTDWLHSASTSTVVTITGLNITNWRDIVVRFEIYSAGTEYIVYLHDPKLFFSYN